MQHNVVEIIRMTKAAGLVSQAIVSIQTLHPETLRVVGRKNLNEQHYDRVLEEFRDLDLPVTGEFMVGLPNSNVDSFKHDLQWACNNDIGVYVHSTILIPNTEIATPEFRERHGMKTAGETGFEDSELARRAGITGLRPGQVVAINGMHESDFLEVLTLTSVFNVFIGESTLKYVMYYLHREHGIGQLRFLGDLMHTDLDKYPNLQRLRDMGNAPASTIIFDGEADVVWDFVSNNLWSDLYAEVAVYIKEHYSISGPMLDMALDVQQFIMAYSTRPCPQEREFPHDFAAYFRDGIAGKPFVPLDRYPPFVLEVQDRLHICSKTEQPEYYEPHHGHTELSSQLRSGLFGFDLKECAPRNPAEPEYAAV